LTPGRGGRADFCAPDKDERHRHRGQREEPADPERAVESGCERVRDGVALTDQDTGARGRHR
jgi:hypothetical protein